MLGIVPLATLLVSPVTLRQPHPAGSCAGQEVQKGLTHVSEHWLSRCGRHSVSLAVEPGLPHGLAAGFQVGGVEDVSPQCPRVSLGGNGLTFDVLQPVYREANGRWLPSWRQATTETLLAEGGKLLS